MAKTKMICPFMDKPCKECAFYIGRHYYLCFCEKYRGYVAEPHASPIFSGRAAKGKNGEFEIPLTIPASSIDPFALPQKDIE